MNQYIARYLYQVKKYMPRKNKDDILKELESLILDQAEMMKDTDEENAILLILKQLGSPRRMAYQYSGLSPIFNTGTEMHYIRSTKLASIIIPLVMLFLKVIELLTDGHIYTLTQFLLKLEYAIPYILYNTLIGLGMLFILYVFITYKMNPFKNKVVKPFDPTLLPKVPSKKNRVQITNEIFTILVSTLFLFLINLTPGLISFEYQGETIALMNQNFDFILVIFNLSMLILIGTHIFHIYHLEKTKMTNMITSISMIIQGIAILLIPALHALNQNMMSDFMYLVNHVILWVIGVAMIIYYTYKIVVVHKHTEEM